MKKRDVVSWFTKLIVLNHLMISKYILWNIVLPKAHLLITNAPSNSWHRPLFRHLKLRCGTIWGESLIPNHQFTVRLAEVAIKGGNCPICNLSFLPPRHDIINKFSRSLHPCILIIYQCFFWQFLWLAIRSHIIHPNSLGNHFHLWQGSDPQA